MAEHVTPVPDGYHSVTPWIIGKDTAGLIDFLEAAFGAQELGRMTDEQGNIGHAEVRIGDSVVMMFDKPDWPPTPAFLRLYVDDVDATFERAVAAGATVVTRPTHMFWGDLVGRLSDPFGNLYWVQTRIEVVDEAEMARRMSDEKFVSAMEYVQRSLFVPRTG
jgi:PhnB protein